MSIVIDFSALLLLYVCVLFPKWRRTGRECLLVHTLFYIYLSLVLYVTLMPIITSLPFFFNHPYTPMNLAPFIDVTAGRGDSIKQVVLNIIMTVPFGYLFPLTRRKEASFAKTVFYCFLMSFSIELLQPLINGIRASDITDIITNVLGGIIGYGLYRIFQPISDWLLTYVNKTSK